MIKIIKIKLKKGRRAGQVLITINSIALIDAHDATTNVQYDLKISYRLLYLEMLHLHILATNASYTLTWPCHLSVP